VSRDNDTGLSVYDAEMILTVGYGRKIMVGGTKKGENRSSSYVLLRYSQYVQ
jgi:hypothetical protein